MPALPRTSLARALPSARFAQPVPSVTFPWRRSASRSRRILRLGLTILLPPSRQPRVIAALRLTIVVSIPSLLIPRPPSALPSCRNPRLGCSSSLECSVSPWPNAGALAKQANCYFGYYLVRARPKGRARSFFSQGRCTISCPRL